MRHEDFVGAFSKIRIAKYEANANNKLFAQELYRCNIRVSYKFLALVAIFEVTLRNAIDRHYKYQLKKKTGRTDWLKAAVDSKGFLTTKGCEPGKLLVQTALKKLKSKYSHDKLLSELSFGFWRYLFAERQYRAGGSNLLGIFTFRPKGIHQREIFHGLSIINRLRNRAAHHEPLIFDAKGRLSLKSLLHAYNNCLEFGAYLGYQPSELYDNIDELMEEIYILQGRQSPSLLLA